MQILQLYTLTRITVTFCASVKRKDMVTLGPWQLTFVVHLPLVVQGISSKTDQSFRLLLPQTFAPRAAWCGYEATQAIRVVLSALASLII